MGSRCKRCVIDSIRGYHHPSCYTCFLRETQIKVCVVCFKNINNNSQLCGKCEYEPTIEITHKKKRKTVRFNFGEWETKIEE